MVYEATDPATVGGIDTETLIGMLEEIHVAHDGLSIGRFLSDVASFALLSVSQTAGDEIKD